MDDVNVIYTKGTGPGGQHKNKTQSCVIMSHIPTGIKVKVDGRNQHHNYDNALKELKKRLKEKNQNDYNNDYSSEKRNQIGVQNRSNRRRTYNFRNGIVSDHLTNKNTSVKNILKGRIDLLH